MQGVEYVEEVFEVCLTLFAVVEEKKQEGKQCGDLEIGRYVCNDKQYFHCRHADNFHGQTIQFFPLLGGRYAVNIVKEPTVCQNNAWKTLKIDGEKMPRDAVFRFREEGDEIKLFGGGTKSLKKLLNEKKLPVEERGYLPVIAQAGGKKVYAVCGVEIADELKVDENTVRVLYIVLQRK